MKGKKQIRSRAKHAEIAAYQMVKVPYRRELMTSTAVANIVVLSAVANVDTAMPVVLGAIFLDFAA